MKKYIDETLNLIIEDVLDAGDTLNSLEAIMGHHTKDLRAKMQDDSLELYDLSRKAKMFKSNARRLTRIAEMLIGCSEALNMIVTYEEEKEKEV